MKHIIYILMGLLFVTTTMHANDTEQKSSFQILNIPNLNDIVQNIPLSGTLQFGSDENEIGLLYLKVDDQFFEALLPFINDENIEVGSSTLGAHMSIMRYSMGDTVEDMANLPELGNNYQFKIKYLATVKPDHDLKWERVWLLVVESPELENLRESYGLTRKLHNNQHDFHITIAVKLVQ